MKIVQITVEPTQFSRPNIYGLGDDNKLYIWVADAGWQEYK